MDKEEKLPSIAELAKIYGIFPIKKLGQNFLFDSNLCDKIVKSSRVSSKDLVLEVGPGPGGLTRSILNHGVSSLHVVDMDKRLLPLLERIKTHHPNLSILISDALKLPLKDLGAKLNNKITIISNLPYNVGTPLLINWLQEVELIKTITIMLQKEVVERIVAAPHSKEYGRLSILAQTICEVSKEFDVSPKAFHPQPKIWSSVVHLKPKNPSPPPHIIKNLEKITSLAFGQRRKMIKTSLKPLGIDFLSFGIDDNLRAENITIEEYLRMASDAEIQN